MVNELDEIDLVLMGIPYDSNRIPENPYGSVIIIIVMNTDKCVIDQLLSSLDAWKLYKPIQFFQCWSGDSFGSALTHVETLMFEH